MDTKYNSSEDDAPLCPIYCNLYVGYVHLCSLAFLWLPLRYGERLPFLVSTLFPLIMIWYLRRPEHIRPSHAACRWFTYKHSAALHYFRQELEPIFQLVSYLPMSHRIRTYGFKWLICWFAKSFRSSPKERRSIRKPFHQWCSARYTQVCRVYPLSVWIVHTHLPIPSLKWVD